MVVLDQHPGIDGDEMPRTPLGKIQKFVLRRELRGNASLAHTLPTRSDRWATPDIEVGYSA